MKHYTLCTVCNREVGVRHFASKGQFPWRVARHHRADARSVCSGGGIAVPETNTFPVVKETAA